MVDESTAVVAESSPAPVTTESSPSLDIPRSNSPEYQKWRETGELPQAKPAVEESAPSDKAKEPSDDAADSAANETQESKARRKPDVEARFKEYSDRIKRLETELEQARTKTPAESSPAKPPAQPQTYQDWRKAFKPTEWVNEYAKANPEASYEDVTAAMADHLGDVRDQFRAIEQARESQAKALGAKVSEAQSRYENFNETVSPFVDKFIADPAISPLVKSMVDGSDIFADLAFTLAGDAKFMEVAKDPAKAIRYIANVERLIQEELAKGGKPETTARNDQGRFVKAEAIPPAKRGPESAPAPPLEIGSRGTGAVDESDRALQAIERGDGNAVRAFFDAENRKDLSRRSGR